MSSRQFFSGKGRSRRDTKGTGRRSKARRRENRWAMLRIEWLEPRRLLSGDLYVTRLTPLGPAGHPFDLLDIQFSKPVLNARSR